MIPRTSSRYSLLENGVNVGEQISGQKPGLRLFREALATLNS
jgi:hypothetical protein